MLDQEEAMVVTVMKMTGEERGWTLHCMDHCKVKIIPLEISFCSIFYYCNQ